MALLKSVDYMGRLASYWKITDAFEDFTENKTVIAVRLYYDQNSRNTNIGNYIQAYTKFINVAGYGYTVEQLYELLKLNEFFADATDVQNDEITPKVIISEDVSNHPLDETIKRKVCIVDYYNGLNSNSLILNAVVEHYKDGAKLNNDIKFVWLICNNFKIVDPANGKETEVGEYDYFIKLADQIGYIEAIKQGIHYGDLTGSINKKCNYYNPNQKDIIQQNIIQPETQSE